MTVGVVGLGRMGFAIAQRLLQAGFSVVGIDEDQAKKDAATAAGMVFAASYQELAQSAQIIWLMVPAGAIVDTVLAVLLPHCSPGKIIIDGGNSFFKDSVRRHAALAEQGVEFIDCGTSGGLHGSTLGYSLMIGGDGIAVAKCMPIFKAVAMQPGGYQHVGPAGAGHYVKMVHNGIEYALLQAYGEGFQMIKEGPYKGLDCAGVAKVWNHGSIIRSWICQLAEEFLVKDQTLDNISGVIGENKTGQWTVEVAKDHGIPVETIEKSLAIRAWSRATGGNYGTKIVAKLREAFGGHSVQGK